MREKIFMILLVISLSSIAFGQEKEVTRPTIVKEFLKETTGLRLRVDAVEAYTQTLNEMSLQVARRAGDLARQENRTSILKRDIDEATEEVFRRAPMTIAEIMEKITQLSIIDMAELSSQIRVYGERLLESRKRL